VDLDSLSPISQARDQMGADQILLGNINPVKVLRNGTPDDVWQAVARCHRDAGRRFIIGAGCEVPRDTPDENIRMLAEYSRTADPISGAS
jgi:uroporphyrinogen-III decarboxylase